MKSLVETTVVIRHMPMINRLSWLLCIATVWIERHIWYYPNVSHRSLFNITPEYNTIMTGSLSILRWFRYNQSARPLKCCKLLFYQYSVRIHRYINSFGWLSAVALYFFVVFIQISFIYRIWFQHWSLPRGLNNVKTWEKLEFHYAF